jgi:hypothetical protein
VTKYIKNMLLSNIANNLEFPKIELEIYGALVHFKKMMKKLKKYVFIEEK